jgi:hypothetical protein
MPVRHIPSVVKIIKSKILKSFANTFLRNKFNEKGIITTHVKIKVPNNVPA